MATLTEDSLIDCYYIPSFIPSGTKMVFNGTNSPSSWTKDTTYNDYSLRVVTGSVTTGGSTAFSSIMTQLNSSMTLSPASTSITIDQRTTNVSTDITGGLPGSPAPTIQGPGLQISFTSNLADLPAHAHAYTGNGLGTKTPGPSTNRAGYSTTLGTTDAGSSQQHTHTLSYVPGQPVASQGPHSHPISWTHAHPSTITSHTHAPGSFSVQQDFRVYYRDVIIASKD